MRQYALVIICLILFKPFCFSQETLTGKFKLNEILNEHKSLDEKQKAAYKSFISQLNFSLMETYLKEIAKENFQKAKNLIKKDQLLSQMETREIAAFYSLYIVNQNELLDYFCITLELDDLVGTKAVYLTKEQLDKLHIDPSKEISIKVQFISEAKQTAFKIYRIVDN